MSFYTSLTGLNAATAQLGVTSNNIANVGTTGFKRSRVDFGDIFATSPLQRAASVIGQGVAIKSVTQEFTQGNLQFSANSLNMGISGDGFFVMKSADGLQDVYTRSGEFVLNEDYAVVNSSKQTLIAAAVDDAGKADLSKLSKLVIPRATVGDARETTLVNLGLNLPADGAVIRAPFNPADSSTYNLTTGVTVFDEAGNGYLATVYYVKTQNATTTDPTNKWQTHVFIGDTKLEEKLIQATSPEGAKLFVNQYGETRSFAAGTEPPVYEGTPLYYMDSLNDRIDSTPATAKGDALTLTKITNWQTGYSTDKLRVATQAETGFTVTNPAAGLGNGTVMKMMVGNTSYTFTGTAVAEDSTYLKGLESIRTQLNNAFAASATGFTTSIVNGQLMIKGNRAGDPLPTFTFSTTTAGANGVTTAITANPALTKSWQAGASFKLNVDNSKDPIVVDLSSLTAENTAITGADMAREMTKLINQQYGDERYFDFTNYLSAGKVSLFQMAVTTAEESASQSDFKMITFEAGANEDMSKITIADAVSRIQDAVRAIKPGVTVGYDAVNKSFTFKDSSDTNRVHLRSSGGLASDGFFGMGGTQYTTVDPVTGLYGAYTIPNGDMIREKSDQRYGIKVSFGDEGFSIASGSTGDESSIAIYAADERAKDEFGLSISSQPKDG
ncbi:MAG: flagellar hook-basal body complex protein, partial [Betaproteobacteria bacterium]|nr:flagellar hook-basal body complex protein [Betaproteobacteria bacterium]